MIIQYWGRLACICLASFYLIHAAVGVLVSQLSQWTIGVSAKIRPREAARLFLILRLTPLCLSVFAVIALCIPSYLRYEKTGVFESVSIICMTLCFLGLATCGVSAGRAIRAFVRSIAVARKCSSIAHPEFSATASSDLQVTEVGVEGMPPLALIGILRPKLFVSRQVLKTLSKEQLEAAFSHEQAHLVSRDNFKRLLIILAPDIFPFAHCFKKIDRQWRRSIELAADEYATSGKIGASVALAEALLRVARLEPATKAVQLASPLLANNQELALRINRLLTPDAAATAPRGSNALLWLLSFALPALTFLMLQSSALYSIHRLLELILR